jgi:hypothetical protein
MLMVYSPLTMPRRPLTAAIGGKAEVYRLLVILPMFRNMWISNVG